MAFGISYPVQCACGHDLLVHDFSQNPPPVPGRVAPLVTDDAADGRWFSTCPDCGDELDAEKLLRVVEKG